MTYNNRTVHRDKNHKTIVTALRGAGLRVFDTAALGDGFPDLVVQRPDGRIVLVEIKSDHIPGGEEIRNEVKFMMTLVNENYRLVDSPEMAIRALSALS